MHPRLATLFTFLGLLLALLLILQTPLTANVRGWVWDAWIRGIAGFFSIGPLQISNDALTQMHTLQSENFRLQAQLRDYNALRAEIGQGSFDSFQALPAAIAARPLDTFHSEYVLNRGVQEGVTANAPVAVFGSTLIGFITELHDHTSVMQLLVHPNTTMTAATVPHDLGAPPARGLLKGRQYTSLALTTIPRDFKVSVGEPVVTVAKENSIPAGLVIGTIKNVTAVQNEAYQEAEVAFSYSIDSLSAVTILLPP